MATPVFVTLTTQQVLTISTALEVLAQIAGPSVSLLADAGISGEKVADPIGYARRLGLLFASAKPGESYDFTDMQTVEETPK